MKRRYIKSLECIGSGLFRGLLSCGHTQEFEGSTRRLPRIAPCQLCGAPDQTKAQEGKTMEKAMVVIDDETAGEVVSGVAEVGQAVTVELQDENGNRITRQGVVTEIL